MFDYGEVCPISRATSVLCERWTLQIIREMLLGATRFSELQRFLPKLSPTLLNTRLRTLEAQGIIVRKKVPEKKSYEYQLTPSGRALQPVLSEMGKWGMSWVTETMNEEQLNISVVIRDFAVALNTRQLPSGDATIQFNIEAERGMVKKFILVREGETQVCEENPGTEVDIYLSATLKTLHDIWFGNTSITMACDSGLLKLVGSSAYTRNLSRWLCISQFAPYNNRTEA